jgi:hypothetical protein
MLTEPDYQEENQDNPGYHDIHTILTGKFGLMWDNTRDESEIPSAVTKPIAITQLPTTSSSKPKRNYLFTYYIRKNSNLSTTVNNVQKAQEINCRQK